MAPPSWQNRLKDAFSGLNLSPEPNQSPPQRYGNSPGYYRPAPPIPPRPSPPVPSRPPPIRIRAFRLLELPIIEVELILPSGQQVLRRQDLDLDLGNENGTFAFSGKYFSKSARNVYIHDATLYAELGSRDGRWFQDKVGLDVDIPEDGKLTDIAIRLTEYHARHSPSVPNERSRLCADGHQDCHSLRMISDFIVGVDCRQADGTYASSYVDLNEILGNEGGVFVRGGKDFSFSSRSIKLYSTTVTAELADYDGGWPERTIDLSRLVRCASGRLVPYNVQDPFDMPEAAPKRGIPRRPPLSGCLSATLLGRTLLVAKCEPKGGRSYEAAFKLDQLFGVIDKQMRPFGHDFHKWPEITDVTLDGSLWTVHSSVAEPQTFDLDQFIANVDGKLEVKKEGPCDRCRDAFRAGRLYSPCGDRERNRLDFKIDEVNRDCALCQIVESIILSTVPFIRSCEVHLECWSEYFPNKYRMETVELDINLNNISRKYRVYLDSDEQSSSRAYEMMPLKEHGDTWFEPSQRWSLITSLVNECFHNHTDCQRKGRPVLPSRVVDIGLSPDDGVRVISAENEVGKYACLSHCWGHGNTNTCRLTSETYARYMTDIPPEELPRNYTDAISVCRSLGLRYIWIDSLCILQDSKADWQAESPKMIKYYGQCHVCIAATNISGPHSGLDIADRPHAFRATGVDQDGASYGLIAYPSHLVEPIPHFSRADKSIVQRNFPLMTRAWVLQERWLAPRTLHFCGKEIVFECTEGLKCECGHAEDSYLLQVGGDDGRVMAIENMNDGIVLKRRKGTEVKWTQFISAYSSLSLTFGTDHLPAISGLARDFADRRVDKPPGKYLAGLWSNTLHEELVWFVGEPLLRYRDKPKAENENEDDTVVSPVAQNSKLTTYIAPSWSWASVFETIRYRGWDEQSTKRCQVLDSSIILDGTDEYAAVAPGCSLTFRGRLLRTRWSTIRGQTATEYVLSNVIGTQRLDRYESPGIQFLPDYIVSHSGAFQLSPNEDLFVLPVIEKKVELRQWSYNLNDKEAVEKEIEFANRIRIIMCLVLRRLSSRNTMPAYERVGFTEWSNIRAGVENEDSNQYVDETFVVY